MMFKSLQILIAFCILFVSTVQAGLICPLCGSVNRVPARWDHVLSTSPFKTCRTVYFEMAMRPINHPTCAPMQRQYGATCCNAGPPPPAPPAPAPKPAPIPASGHPYCRICRNDDFPGFPNVMISARYVGTYSCGSLFHRGKNGNIPGFMCGPLQSEVHNKCGCGQRPPTNRPTPPPVPRPTPRPTRRPTPHPTRRPTPPPTRSPTPPPTPPPTKPPTPPPTPPPTSPPTPPPTPPPTTKPSAEPSTQPSESPSSKPSASPSGAPTSGPTTVPSATPSVAPSPQPSLRPTSNPTSNPTTSQAPSSLEEKCDGSPFKWCCLNGNSICCHACSVSF